MTGPIPERAPEEEEGIATFICNVDLVGGDPSAPSVSGPQVPPEDSSAPPPRAGGILSRFQDTAPFRYFVLRRNPVRRALRSYPVDFLSRYRQLVDSHVAVQHRKTFGFYPGLPSRADVVLSKLHGAAVFFTKGTRRRVSLTVTDDRIEHYVWPSTKSRGEGKKTTFKSKENEIAIFVPGKRMRAGGGLSVEIDGVLIYEGRMVLKGAATEIAWSRSAARLDGLLAFLRSARAQIRDEAKLRMIEGSGVLEAVAGSIASMELTRTHTTQPEVYLNLTTQYFQRADQLGIHTVSAERLLAEIKHELAQPRSRARFWEQWGKPIAQNLIATAILAVGGALLVGAPWVGVLIAVAGLTVVGFLLWCRRGNTGK